MSYEANYETAMTYFNAGLKDRAQEALSRALNTIEEKEKNKENVIYFRVLTLLARSALEKGERQEAMRYIVEGLKLKQDHADLLFMECLFFWDRRHYNEMLAALLNYLVAIISPEAKKFRYEFVGEGALKEVFENLLPVSYGHSTQQEKTMGIVEKLSETTRHPLLRRTYHIMQEVAAKRGSHQHEKAK